MKKEKYLFLYTIAILTTLLVVSIFGYLNYKNKSFTGLDKQVVYKSGKKIKYADLNWYVVKDNGTNVTLILSKNSKLSSFDSIEAVNTYLNEAWLKEVDTIKLNEEINHGAIVLNKNSKYIRLITKEELEDNPIKNDSKTPYWTMTFKDKKVYYALPSGYTEYTTYDKFKSKTKICYKGTEAARLDDITKNNQIIVLNSKDAIALPTDDQVITSVDMISKTETCKTNYKVKNGLFYEDGKDTSYITGWDSEEVYEYIGLRPVITVKKK